MNSSISPLPSENQGIFKYHSTGFSVLLKSEITQYKWDDIETITGYKLDLLTTDEICMDIVFCDNSCLTLYESTTGWSYFNESLFKSIPSINKEWETGVMHPALKTNLTLLFDKKDRSQEAVLKELYK